MKTGSWKILSVINRSYKVVIYPRLHLIREEVKA